jgi:hypothetical protein
MAKKAHLLPLNEGESLLKLRRLISCLTQTEKNLFKKQIRNYSSDNGNAQYVQLFNCINDCWMETVREMQKSEESVPTDATSTDGVFYAKFKSRFASRDFMKADELGSKANYLYDKIVEAMRAYNPERIVRRKMLELMADIQFVYRKGLYDICLKMISDAHQLADKIGASAFKLELYQTERRIRVNTNSEKTLKLLRKIGEQEQNCLNELSHLTAVFDLYHETLIARRENVNIEEAEILKTKINAQLPFLTNPDLLPERSFDLNHYYHGIRANLIFCDIATPAPFLKFLQHQKHRSQYEHLKKAVELFETEPDRIKDDPLRYRINLINYLSLSYSMGILVDLVKYESVLTDVDTADTEFLSTIVHINLIFNAAKKDFLASEKFLQKYKVWELMAQKGQELAISRRQVICYSAGVAFFVREKFVEAEPWFNANLMEQSRIGSIEAMITSAACHLMIQIESETYDQHKYKSTLLQPLQRILQKTNQDQKPFELAVEEAFKKLLKLKRSDRAFNIEAGKLSLELKAIQQELGYEGALGLVIGWLESKATGKQLRYTVEPYL